MERYWSGGTTKDPDETPCVDVFVDGSEIWIGAHDGEKGVKVVISKDTALKLSAMLTESVQRAQAWDESN